MVRTSSLVRALAFVISFVSIVQCQSASLTDLTRYVNLFIGTQGTVPGTSFNGGNVFPGASLPFGVVKVGIDTTEFNSSIEANAGYTPDGNITAISFLHESGTGGAPKYGVVPQMPLTTLDGVNVLDNTTYSQPKVGDDTASVGYYKTTMKNGVTAEMSATRHAGIIKYTGAKYILVDISHYLPTNGEPQHGQLYNNGHIDVSENGRNYSGHGVWRGGWNQSREGEQRSRLTNEMALIYGPTPGPNWQVYFCGSFDVAPANTRLFRVPTPIHTGPTRPTLRLQRRSRTGHPSQEVLLAIISQIELARFLTSGLPQM